MRYGILCVFLFFIAITISKMYSSTTEYTQIESYYNEDDVPLRLKSTRYVVQGLQEPTATPVQDNGGSETPGVEEVKEEIPTPTQVPQIVTPIEQLICSYPWDCSTALRIAGCESGYDPSATSPTGDYGLFQINQIHASKWPDFWESWMVAERNAQYAWEIYADQFWYPWSCY